VAVGVCLVALVAGACSRQTKIDGLKATSDAKAGGTITVAIPAPGSIEPGNVHDAAGRLVVETMCDPLIQLDPVTGEMKGALADSWQVGDRGKRITIRLRRGLRMSNGARLTADDVVRSLTRAASEDYAGYNATLLSPIDGYPIVHGDERTDDDAKKKRLAGTRVIENVSFEIRLTEGNADFVRILTSPVAMPIAWRTAEKDPAAFAHEPVCAGPYRLAAPWKPGDPSIRLVRNERYKPVNSGLTRSGAGWADEIVFKIVPDLAAAAADFGQGGSDVATVPLASVASLRGSDPAHLVEGVGSGIEYIGLSATKGLTAKPAVRIALSQAIDRKELIARVFGGSRVPAAGFIGPSVGDEGFKKDACGARAPASGSADAAAATLRAAGVDLHGALLPLAYNDELNNKAVAEEVARQWRAALGVDVQLVAMPWDKYLAQAVGAQGFDGAFRLRWAPAYPSADSYLASPFSAAGIGRDNFSRFSNRTFDLDLERVARRQALDADRAAEYLRLEARLCEAMPMIPLTVDGTRFLVRTERLASATGSFTARGDGLVDVRDIYVKTP
jgi:peptide/nickel transport system substrate-binding protein/oligopeptide transport system substrate-binding protein